ncbi:MAG: adenylyl-sulfate kinase [Byssovorax sp.]
MSEGFVVWFTGLSGAGKSTLAAMLSTELRRRGVHVEVLDGDEVRTHLSKGLGFSREDRDTNIRRIGFVAKLLARSGACAMTAAISPYRAIRDEQRAHTPRFVEVHVTCAIPTLADRDPKGLYRKALAGEIKGFTGVDDPYEPPERPEVTVDTGVETREESLGKILRALEDLGYVPGAAGGVSEARSAAPGLIRPHGGELVDRVLRGAARDALDERARGLHHLVIDAQAERDLAAIGDGSFSPLRGFMNEKDYRKVLGELRLESGLPWPLPITLAVTEEEARALRAGQEVTLCRADGRRLAVLEVSDLYRPDRDREAQAIAGTTDPAHPDVTALHRRGPVRVGGEVRLLDPIAPPRLHALSGPQATREEMRRLGLSRVVGFQARGPMTREHEHWTKAALELCDGLLVHAALDPAGDGAPPERLLEAHEALLSRYYPRARAILASGHAAPHAAGARATLLAALVLKNHGCSWAISAAPRTAAIERAFEHVPPAELGIELLFLEGAFFSTITGMVATAKTAPPEPLPPLSPPSHPPPPSASFRPEVAALLAARSPSR